MKQQRVPETPVKKRSAEEEPVKDSGLANEAENAEAQRSVTVTPEPIGAGSGVPR